MKFIYYCLMIPKNSLDNNSAHHYSWEPQPAAFCLVNSSCLAHVSTIFSLCIPNKYLFKSMKCQLSLNEMGHKKPLCNVTFSSRRKNLILQIDSVLTSQINMRIVLTHLSLRPKISPLCFYSKLTDSRSTIGKLRALR